ncbi:C40 family peptidase [Paenibacillus sp. GCM10027628]|uniref:C40 family peptidase n=1 Tax=Paenibacillus sp. GCM10027628 TaxID=3273413 RepID=UPI0036349E6D
MWNKLKATAMGSMVVILATTAGCGSNQAIPKSSAPTATPSVQQQGISGSNLTHSMAHDGQGINMLSTDNAVLPVKAIGNINYVSANDLIRILKFQSGWDNDKLKIGDNDANYELIMNSTKASKEGHEIQVKQPFVKEGDTAYIPTSALADLFQEDMAYSLKDGQLLIHPSSIMTIENEDDPDPNGMTAELNFGNDPTDPFKGGEGTVNPVSGRSSNTDDLQVWSPSAREEDMPVLKNIDVNGLISKGKQYLGVPYVFGTGPYPQTGKFDCSTYTQYLFGKYGVSLPRVARQQASMGTLVSRNNLRKGDLLFFRVPGRFKSNNTVGHVGIYIGNMQMLNALPPVVRITNIDKPYWKRNFLSARRIVS